MNYIEGILVKAMSLNKLFQNRVSMWVRYSDYEIKENERGVGYIVPCPDASFTVYDPADISTDLVSDALNAGRELNDNQRDASVRQTVLRFTRKYGLLGWMTALPMDADFYKEKETYLGRNGGLPGKKIMPTDEFVNFFLLFGVDDSKTNPSTIAYAIGREKIYETIFSKGYGEPYLWLAGFLLHLFQHFFSTLRCNSPDFTTDERATMRHEAAGYDNYGISFHLSANQRIEMKWEFDSLKTVVETAYSLYITAESSPLRMCKHCRKAYYNTNQRSEFCSGRCKNQWNVYKSRNKNSN